MRELMNLVNDIAPLVKIGWLIFFVWALGQIAWYRRARIVTWSRIAAPKPLPRKVAPPIARPAAARPVEDAPAAPAPATDVFEPMAASVAEPDAATVQA